MIQAEKEKKIILSQCMPQESYILSFNFMQTSVRSKWVFRVPGTSDCRISKWDLHRVAEKSCRQNILFREIMPWMPSLPFKEWESRSVRIFLFLRYELSPKTVYG